MALIEEAHKAARILLDHAYVRIVARAEPDATCAAALLAHALRRENVDLHVSWTRRLDEPTLRALAEERSDCTIFLGLSGDPASPPASAGRTIVLDTAPPTIAGDSVVHDDAAIASLAHLVAAGISKRNLDLAPLALAGALAQLRHVGGFRGLDAEILKEATDMGVLLREPSLALPGSTLAIALAQLDAPYIAGVTGRARNVKKLLGELHLSADAPPGSLAPPEGERLGDFLTLRLLQQGAPDAGIDALFRSSLRGLQGPHTGVECGEMARLAEAACAAGRGGLAFSALWPDASAGGEALDLLGATREALVQALVAAERDAKVEGALVVASAPSAALCQPLADRIALSRGPDGAIVAVHAQDGEGAFVALRSFARDAGDAARKAAPIAGAVASGSAGSARLFAPDASRALKALAEVVA